VLVGTTSIENSELLSGLLKEAKLPHNVLNAKQHAQEAQIVADAGRPGMITIATNMAGRGTDIVLGGNVSGRVDQIQAHADLDEASRQLQIEAVRAEWQQLHDQVVAAGGLHIIGTERHESRRIDNQLRGRSGRQGDPGSSRFFMSMDDPLLKIFAGDRLKAIMDRLKLPEGEAIEAGMVSRSIESAQRKVEARNFDIRKQLLEYDDVSNDQRKVIYQQRNDLLESVDTEDLMTGLRQGVFTDLFRAHVPEDSVEEQWDAAALQKILEDDWKLEVPITTMLAAEGNVTDDDLLAGVLKAADSRYAEKVDQVGREGFQGFERSIMLQSIDQRWREHLSALDHLRQGIHLRGYAQKNPKQEYKREAFDLFENMLNSIRDEVVRILMNVQIQSAEQAQQAEAQVERQAEQSYSQASFTHAEFAAAPDADAESVALAVQNAPAAQPEAEGGEQPFRRFGNKIGRNDPCPCGSGKKYKVCHGRLG
jgi:preprotein translocase subunit SecA